MIPTLYTGSVKNLLGPVLLGNGKSALIFEYTDAFSIFDWGRLPDVLEKKGESLALLAALLLERLEQKEAWQNFRKTKTAMALCKAAEEQQIGDAFQRVGDRLCEVGLRTHLCGVLLAPLPVQNFNALSASQLTPGASFSHLLVQQVSVVRPHLGRILQQTVPDYSRTRLSPLPRLIPLEVIFRFSCPPGSSLPGRMPSVTIGDRWEFPFLEVFTKLESSDRPLSLTEALAISGISPLTLDVVLLQTAWVAGFLKELCQQKGLELADGKLEWALGEQDEVVLVDAIGPDELRILKDEMQLSKEFLRNFYRKTSWFKSVQAAKKEAMTRGTPNWKNLVSLEPPRLPPELCQLGSQLYQTLANCLSGHVWFQNAWSLKAVLEQMKQMQQMQQQKNKGRSS